MIRIEEMLKTLTASEIANRLDITADSLRYHLKVSGVDVNQIKRDYAIETLGNLSCNHTIKEVMKITGFSRRKVFNFAEEGYITFKFSNKKQ